MGKLRQATQGTRELTIIAQDPAFRKGGKIVRAVVDVPIEELLPGPCGYRVNVIDFDVGANVVYSQAKIPEDVDPFADKSDDELTSDPRFHAQNVYAIVMRTAAAPTPPASSQPFSTCSA